ncbi:MAG: MurR/RpiR family transcriptional regulator [Paracoccaceae bacterium]
MIDAPPTTEQRLRGAYASLTRTERQLADHMLRHYPVAALASITALAKAADVSTPTVVRLVQKVGYKGYPDFQGALRSELEERLTTPLAKHDRWSTDVPDGHVLNRFADAVVANLQATLAQVDHAEFDAICAALADTTRNVHALGGRITHAMADYLVTHLKVMRPGVTLLSDASSTWPPALLDIRSGDLVVAFDIRRYENSVLSVLELAVEQGAEVILLTDQWISPAASLARHRISCHVEAPSAWDSTVTLQVMVETLLAGIQALIWDETQTRMKRLEGLYERSRLFRRSR